jgi:hypothetical protein
MRHSGSSIDIFFCSPPILSQRRGEAQSRGESKIRDELSFQASEKFRKKQTGSESPESLGSRNLRTLDGVPRSGRLVGGTEKKHSPTISISVQLEASSASFKVSL